MSELDLAAVPSSPCTGLTTQDSDIELPEKLPAIREDLRLIPGATLRDGSPAWMIQDPVGNRFFNIGWLEFEMLSRWPLGSPTRLLDTLAAETPLRVSRGELAALLLFLSRHQLLHITDVNGTRSLEEMARLRGHTGWRWLLHNYLFMRVPLWRPQRLLQKTLPWVAPLFSRALLTGVAVAILFGLFFVEQQWDEFVASFKQSLSPQGMVGYLIALAVTKCLHELGHAYTATRYGVRVAHMGVAFLVLWPVLYTDTSESWKLADRRQRFHIAGAGILVELMIAGIATLGWGLCENPMLKSALFFLATTSWMISLALNASPFMRFDGYFLLSDWLDLPNLHERSGALAQAWMRRRLLAWNEPDPEVVAPRLRRFLIAFALITRIYRLVVFLGIAVAVYYLFFKALGIFLFLVEISWFVIMPIQRELKVWWRRRKEIPARRGRVLLLAPCLLGLVVVLPLNTHVQAPAWLHAEVQYTLYSPLPARLMEMSAAGQRVEADSVLAVLDSPQIRDKAERSYKAALALRAQLDGLAGAVDGAQKYASIASQLSRQQAESAAQSAELQRLSLRAPMAGVLTDIDPSIQPGVWVKPNQPLGVLVNPASWTVEAFVRQQDLSRLSIGARARFYAEGDAGTALGGQVVSIDDSRTQNVPHLMLSTAYGGPIPVSGKPDSSLQVRDALYRVRISLDTPPAQTMMRLGKVSIEGAHVSPVAGLLTDALSILIRESGF
ncbi:putative peptide zinc metalloprotease protein [Pseudomonas sp. SJZ085]|uniref:HlyD family efflux transporter periplasmic adaptor subunit n=1 Tax=unclassified Pseudomonas TaxID=196821 RepID=UPI00119A22A6|nr:MULTISPECIES: HlyD family efflux transporter periplasmic adaptor subunit [unclassified Pseudomonas]TWC17807.1 putative peptide zinc metalloprotease protein [Pseudomonas sp. SJZ074]TWC35725.1 putative peptide zinc metalloprotease protein [Pseudomonas sp. SJZ085]